MINNLLSICGNDQSNASSSCDKHDGEILKLFCQTCDQLICRDCTLIDHRDHKYTFVKEIFPAVKEEIVDIVQKSRANIRALESSIETIKGQEFYMQVNCMNINREIDSLIDNLIEHLERKRQSIKDDLRKSVTAQKENQDEQMESFHTSLGCLKSSVEFTEEALTRGSEVEILSAKNQIIQQLTELNSATSGLKPRGRIYYSLETDFKPRERIYNPQENLDAQMESFQASLSRLESSVEFTEEAVTRESEVETYYPQLEKIAEIRDYDMEYELLQSSDKNRWIPISIQFRTPTVGEFPTRFCIRPKSKSSTLGQASKVQVTIIEPDSKKVQVPVTYDSDGSVSFSYKPERLGRYEIEVLINRRYVHGSPFSWKVGKSFLEKIFEKMSS